MSQYRNYLSRFNVGTGHGQKREWEVGNKSRYDDLLENVSPGIMDSANTFAGGLD